MSFFFPCMNCPEKESINFSDTALQDGAVIPTGFQVVANLVTWFTSILAHWFSASLPHTLSPSGKLPGFALSSYKGTTETFAQVLPSGNSAKTIWKLPA